VLAHGGVGEGVDDSGTDRERAGFGSRHRSASGGGLRRAEGDVDAFHIGAPTVLRLDVSDVGVGVAAVVLFLVLVDLGAGLQICQKFSRSVSDLRERNSLRSSLWMMWMTSSSIQ
jgi:hypothetical protein